MRKIYENDDEIQSHEMRITYLYELYGKYKANKKVLSKLCSIKKYKNFFLQRLSRNEAISVEHF